MSEIIIRVEIRPAPDAQPVVVEWSGAATPEAAQLAALAKKFLEIQTITAATLRGNSPIVNSDSKITVG